MAAKRTKIDKIGFEDAIEQLEELIEQIESGEIGLEESLKRYEEGSALIKRCRTILDGAQAKITELTVDADGLSIPGQENQGDTAENADD